MKNIKFRAWDKINGEMIPWNRLLNGYNLRNVFIGPEMSGLILMQYTGLKDKNGVEIYEGGIVNHYWSNEVGESFCHKTVIKNPFDYKVNEAMHLIYADELEILGNIYENPDFMEV